MPKGTVRWYGKRLMRAVEDNLHKRLLRAAIHLQNEMMKLIDRPGPHGPKAGRGLEASRPGEPPKKGWGHLRGSVNYQIEGAIARVGTDKKYGRYLETGTRGVLLGRSGGRRGFIAPRPWLRPALDQQEHAIARILTEPM